jgi:ISXO2-like transposase domain
MKDEFAAHSEITHKTKKYVRRDGNFKVTTNTVESFFALLKRSNYGIYHMSRKYLGSYCAERDFVYNGRKLNDDERTTKALRQADGKRLMSSQRTPRYNLNAGGAIRTRTLVEGCQFQIGCVYQFRHPSKCV